MVKVITVTTHPHLAQPLLNSLIKHGWDFECIVAPQWLGFGTKLISVYNFLKANPEVDSFIFCDAFDVVALQSPDVFYESDYGDFLLSSERGCWPIPDWEPLYTNRFEHGYNYVNSGLYYAKSKAFIDLMKFDMPDYATDDQMWFSKHFLMEGVMMQLDNNCEVFQSYSFIGDDDYFYNEPTVGCGLYNRKTNTFPIFAHGNGKTDMTKLYELI